MKVISNTVNVTVFVPGEKGKGKADNSTVKRKPASDKNKGKSEDKEKGKDSDSGGYDSGGDKGTQDIDL